MIKNIMVLSLILFLGFFTSGCEEWSGSSKTLPPGYVQGDSVVTYSYVPNKYWTLEEARGVLPYLCEYELFAWDDDKPLEAFHAENVRRIDLASHWSTCVMFYARRLHFRDEIINLMIRAYQRRQLFILRDYWQTGDKHKPFDKTRDILQELWDQRDRILTNPEGDKATGRQLINNILMVKTGDENFCSLGTEGLENIYRTFKQQIQDRKTPDGEQPFKHIKAWYNMVAWGAWDFGSCWASGPDDLAHDRKKLPANIEFIGVDTYDYYWLKIPYDPVLPQSKQQVMSRIREWHRIRTQFFPEGIKTRVCENAGDPNTWISECWSDTHALMNAIQYAQADKAMMIYIGLSSNIPKQTYTTPVETMDAYFEHCKTGPWVGLVWWTTAGRFHPKVYKDGTLGYIDRTLIHYTPDQPEGKPYSEEMLDKLHDDFLASRIRMFQDVVYNQFGHLNARPGN